MYAKRTITGKINGKPFEASVEPRMLLADFLRDELGLTGVHTGCEHGVCGTCTILVNDDLIRSCLMLAVQADGAEIFTVEGLSRDREFGVLQRTFVDNFGLQCGFCTPGMLITVKVLLRDKTDPTEAEIRQALSGNLCRCTGYESIVKAVQAASQYARIKPENASGSQSKVEKRRT